MNVITLEGLSSPLYIEEYPNTEIKEFKESKRKSRAKIAAFLYTKSVISANKTVRTP